MRLIWLDRISLRPAADLSFEGQRERALYDYLLRILNRRSLVVARKQFARRLLLPR